MPETPKMVAYRHYAELVDSARGLLEDFWRNHATISVVAAGFHPFFGRGAELHEALQADLEGGILLPPVTMETVWEYASARGIDYEWAPIAPPPLEGEKQ